MRLRASESLNGPKDRGRPTGSPDWRCYWKPGHENEPQYKLFERVERKYNPVQPLVPAGSSEGGQWTSEGGVGGTDTMSGATPHIFSKPATQIAARSRRNVGPSVKSNSAMTYLFLIQCAPVVAGLRPSSVTANA